MKNNLETADRRYDAEPIYVISTEESVVQYFTKAGAGAKL